MWIFIVIFFSLIGVADAQSYGQCSVNVSSTISSNSASITQLQSSVANASGTITQLQSNVAAASSTISSNSANIAQLQSNLISLQNQVISSSAMLGIQYSAGNPSDPYLDNTTILIGESTCWNRDDYTFLHWNTNNGAFPYVNPARNWCIGGQGMASAKTWSTYPSGTSQFPTVFSGSSWTMYTSLSFMHLLNQTGNFVVMYGINDNNGWSNNTAIYKRAYGAAYNLFANWDGRVTPTASININTFADTPLLGANAPTIIYRTNGQSRICVIYADAGPFANFNVALANGTVIPVTKSFPGQGNPSYAVNYVWIPPTTSITLTGVSGSNAVILAVVQEVTAKRKVLFIVPSAWNGAVSGRNVDPPVFGGRIQVLNAVQTLGLNYFDFSNLVVDAYDGTHPGPLTNAAINKFMYTVNQTQIAPSFFLA